MSESSRDNSGRRHRRFAVALAVEIQPSSWEQVLEVSTGNISRGGLFLCTDHVAEIGSRMTIALKLPNGATLEVEGEVVHAVTPDRATQEDIAPGIGIRFDEKYAIDLNLLEAMAASLSGGRNAYHIDDLYITMPAILREKGATVETTSIHHLLETPGATATASPDAASASPGDAAPSASQPAAEQVSAPSARAPVVQNLEGPCVFGIDFGTSYSSIGLVAGKRLMLLEDDEGQTMIPSVVCYPEDGPPIVGWGAREKLPTHPATTVVSPKRLIGRRYDDRSVDAFVGGSPVQMEAGPDGQIIANLYGSPIAITQICAEIFRHLADIGQRATGRRVEQAVLSAPVTFGAERAALKRAAELAGIEVLKIVDEPVAAAMAYGLGRQSEVVAIYDFGGGTFDFTLLEIADEQFRVLAQAGDNWLGGDDFDLALAEHAANQFWQRYKVDLRKRQVEMQRLLMLCEAAKRRLSSQQHTDVHAHGIVLSIRGPIDLQVALDREQLEQLCGELVDRSISSIDDCLSISEIDRSVVDQVVLVGGVSRMPLVRERLQDYFGVEMRPTVNPEHAIAVGCTIYGHHLAQAMAR